MSSQSYFPGKSNIMKIYLNMDMGLVLGSLNLRNETFQDKSMDYHILSNLVFSDYKINVEI